MKMSLPKDPMMLLSVINTKLRDYYKSLDLLCEDLQVDPNEIKEILQGIGYEYNEKLNKFV
ncbi:MAG: DUF4250 domain-containing protein [Lachnospiraceae bacterium]|nr:DUF4250 domain-containing protein [Lachnospiraceae bacterium]